MPSLRRPSSSATVIPADVDVAGPRIVSRVPSSIRGMAVDLRFPPHFDKHCSLPPHPVLYNYHQPLTPMKIYKYDVTLLTFSSIERIYNMENMVETWTGWWKLFVKKINNNTVLYMYQIPSFQGPIHLAFYVKNQITDIDRLDMLLRGNPKFSEKTTIHLVWANVSSQLKN